ncbi:MAG: hypothetical protein ACTSUE_06995 [Promethearchaeota archaeon]
MTVSDSDSSDSDDEKSFQQEQKQLRQWNSKTHFNPFISPKNSCNYKYEYVNVKMRFTPKTPTPLISRRQNDSQGHVVGLQKTAKAHSIELLYAENFFGMPWTMLQWTGTARDVNRRVLETKRLIADASAHISRVLESHVQPHNQAFSVTQKTGVKRFMESLQCEEFPVGFNGPLANVVAQHIAQIKTTDELKLLVFVCGADDEKDIFTTQSSYKPITDQPEVVRYHNTFQKLEAIAWVSFASRTRTLKELWNTEDELRKKAAGAIHQSQMEKHASGDICHESIKHVAQYAIYVVETLVYETMDEVRKIKVMQDLRRFYLVGRVVKNEGQVDCPYMHAPPIVYPWTVGQLHKLKVLETFGVGNTVPNIKRVFWKLMKSPVAKFPLVLEGLYAVCMSGDRELFTKVDSSQNIVHSLRLVAMGYDFKTKTPKWMMDDIWVTSGYGFSSHERNRFHDIDFEERELPSILQKPPGSNYLEVSFASCASDCAWMDDLRVWIYNSGPDHQPALEQTIKDNKYDFGIVYDVYRTLAYVYTIDRINLHRVDFGMMRELNLCRQNKLYGIPASPTWTTTFYKAHARVCSPNATKHDYYIDTGTHMFGLTRDIQRILMHDKTTFPDLKQKVISKVGVGGPNNDITKAFKHLMNVWTQVMYSYDDVTVWRDLL